MTGYSKRFFLLINSERQVKIVNAGFAAKIHWYQWVSRWWRPYGGEIEAGFP